MRPFIPCLVFLSIGVRVSVPAAGEQPDPLAEILIKKGVLRREDFEGGPADRDRLVEILRRKGILSDAEVQSLRGQGVGRPATSTGGMTVESQAAAAQGPVGVPGSSEVAPWLKGMTLSGDLRFRYEGFVFDGDGLDQSDKKNRHRLRIRLRYGLLKEWDYGLRTGFRLAVQDRLEDPDPIATNDTLGDNLEPEAIFIDRAYLAYRPESAEWFWITGGRFENPFTTTELLFDPDVNLEGLAEKLTWSPLEEVVLQGTIGQVIVNESAAGRDSLLWAWQGSGSWHITDSVGAWFAAAYFNYQNPDANTDLRRDTSRRGNSGSRDDLLFDYRIVDLVARLQAEVMERPLHLWADYAWNVADDKGSRALQEDTAWAAGITFGKLKARNDWDIQLSFRHVEADSVLAIFNDSELTGTNREGFIFSSGWQALQNLELRTSLFLSENIKETLNVADQDFARFQLDAIVKF